MDSTGNSKCRLLRGLLNSSTPNLSSSSSSSCLTLDSLNNVSLSSSSNSTSGSSSSCRNSSNNSSLKSSNSSSRGSPSPTSGSHSLAPSRILTRLLRMEAPISFKMFSKLLNNSHSNSSCSSSRGYINNLKCSSSSNPNTLNLLNKECPFTTAPPATDSPHLSTKPAANHRSNPRSNPN